nr:MAG TPA: hypothetical protein [Caudoviricetes sp.]
MFRDSCGGGFMRNLILLSPIRLTATISVMGVAVKRF